MLAQEEFPEVRAILDTAARHLEGLVETGLHDAAPADHERLVRAHDALRRLAREVDAAYRDLNDLSVERTWIR